MSGRLPTARRVSFALGYIGLGMFREAGAELESIAKAERSRPDVQSAWVDLHLAAKEWLQVIDVAAQLARKHPEVESAWIGWAYALRELNRIEEARAILREAEPLHGGTSAVLHYNLACYASLLGDLPEARKRLATACRLDARLKADSAHDPDLKALRDERRRKH